MICPNCKAGADLRASLPTERPGADEVARNRWTGAMRRVTKLHGKCTNPATCPCQHLGTKHYRGHGASVTAPYHTSEQRYPSGRPGWLGPDQDWPCSRCGQEVSSSELHECKERQPTDTGSSPLKAEG